MSRVLVISNDLVRQRMAGPGIRCLELTRRLEAAGHGVTLTAPGGSDIDIPGVAVHDRDRLDLAALAAKHDIAVVQGWSLNDHPGLLRCSALLVVDLYDPFHLEGLVANHHAALRDQLMRHELSAGVINEQLRHGDFFLCASERQRDFWLGSLGALNRVNPYTHRSDPTLRSLIDAVPFGIPEEPPQHRRRVMRGVIPGIDDGDLVLLWGGGIYDWFDPETLVRGVAMAAASHPEVRLVLHAGRHPNPQVPEMRKVADTRRLADDLGLTGRHVFFNDQWVEYERRADWLLEADIAVSTHINHVETQLAFRTRVLDYLWCSLPIICTEGDTLADLVGARDLGAVVRESSPEAVAGAIDTLSAPAARKRCAANVAGVAQRFTWTTAAAPLLRYCADPHAAADLAARGRRPTRVPLRARPAGGGVPGWSRRAASQVTAEYDSGGMGGVAALLADRLRRDRPPAR